MYKSVYGMKGTLMAGSQQRVAGKQSWDSVGLLGCRMSESAIIQKKPS